MTLAAIVLAGGRGSRLGGVDKASLEIEGVTMLTRTLNAVTGLVAPDDVVVVGDAAPDGVRLVQEEPRFAGPAAAVGAGLAVVDADHVLLLACDQTGVADAVRLLVSAPRERDGAVLVDPDGRRQHLLSLVDVAALHRAVAAQPTLADLSLRRLLAPLDLVEVAAPHATAADLDTWDDVRRATGRGGTWPDD